MVVLSNPRTLFYPVVPSFSTPRCRCKSRRGARWRSSRRTPRTTPPWSASPSKTSAKRWPCEGIPRAVLTDGETPTLYENVVRGCFSSDAVAMSFEAKKAGGGLDQSYHVRVHEGFARVLAGIFAFRCAERCWVFKDLRVWCQEGDEEDRVLFFRNRLSLAAIFCPWVNKRNDVLGYRSRVVWHKGWGGSAAGTLVIAEIEVLSHARSRVKVDHEPNQVDGREEARNLYTEILVSFVFARDTSMLPPVSLCFPRSCVCVHRLGWK